MRIDGEGLPGGAVYVSMEPAGGGGFIPVSLGRFRISGAIQKTTSRVVMNIKKAFTYLYLTAGLLAVVAGCTLNEPYRRNLPDPDHRGVDLDCDCNRPGVTTNCFAVESNSVYGLGFVEFDDQGWFWSHQQWSAVKEEIKAENAATTNGMTIIVFVHGWKNNSAADNGNVQMFRRALAKMAGTVRNRRFFGVYVGWRGLSTVSDILPPGGMELSFYERKAVAERIGHQGAATQVFTELEVMQDEFNETKPATRPRAELVIIGHSFGGQIVYSAISQILTERLILATHKKEAKTEKTEKAEDEPPPVHSLGDLVILLNPAFEASIYENLNALATSGQIHYPHSQRPVLAIFTSTGDWGTGAIFPIGRFFSTLFEAARQSGPGNVWETNRMNLRKNPTPGEYKAIMKTVGHDGDFINFDLKYKELGKAPVIAPSNPTNADELWQLQLNLDDLNTTLAHNNKRQSKHETMQPYVFTGAYTNNSKQKIDYTCTLEPRAGKTNNYSYNLRNPFLNVAVDTHIMSGHNDIENPVVLNFLREFILFATQTNYPVAGTNGGAANK
ncbi:MAG: hypothetical protein JF609_09675 [Verrucomicrobia bacterium]|nr:hypothetical protein [Verrucomicrobiota bacterium]